MQRTKIVLWYWLLNLKSAEYKTHELKYKRSTSKAFQLNNLLMLKLCTKNSFASLCTVYLRSANKRKAIWFFTSGKRIFRTTKGRIDFILKIEKKRNRKLWLVLAKKRNFLALAFQIENIFLYRLNEQENIDLQLFQRANLNWWKADPLEREYCA